MSLTGSLSTMPLVDLLGWLDAKRKTGALVLEGEEAKTTVFLREGRVLSSSSTDPRHYFGQYLLAHTTLTQEQLRRAFDRQEQTRVYIGKNIYIKTLLGKILLEDGLLSKVEILQVLRLKAEETIYDAFLWNDGTFTFRPDELPPEELVPISMGIPRVIQQGVKRAEVWAKIRDVIPSSNATFRIRPGKNRMTPPNSLPAKVLDLIAEGRTLRETMLHLHATEFAVHRIAAELLAADYLELDRVAPDPAPPLQEPSLHPLAADDLVEQGQAMFDRRAFEDTVIAARQALREDPAHDAARRLLERSERQLTDSFYARLFQPDDVPDLGRRLSDEERRALSAEERFLLDQVNGVWNIAAIVRLSPFKEVDALAMLKRLLEAGSIGLKPRPPAT